MGNRFELIVDKELRGHHDKPEYEYIKSGCVNEFNEYFFDTN